MESKKETMEIAECALRLLGYKKIPRDEDLLKTLENIQMLLSSSIDFDILKTIRAIVESLRSSRVKQAEKLLRKLEDLLSAREWE